jgi:putative transposase
VEGFSWHVTQRGVNRGVIFKAPSDYRVFLSILQFESTRSGVEIHAYALMRNHIHVLATPDSEKSLPLLMQGLGRSYVPFFNVRYQRTGALWGSRYKPALVHDERYWLTCMRYVELNPVRAGIVKHAAQYRWSSYWHHGVGHADAVITEHPLYLALASSPEARQRAWREMCGQQLSDGELNCLRAGIKRGIVIDEPIYLEVV